MVLRAIGGSALLLFGALSVTAQGVDPVQQCVWACLAGRNASDPAYHACVAANCGQIPRATAWQVVRLTPDEPPYLDGFAVSTITDDTGLVVRYACGRNGDSWMTFTNQRLMLKYGRTGTRMILFVDRQTRYSLDASEYEGELTASVHLESPLFADLSTAREATLWAEDRTFLGTLPLDAIDSLKKAADTCRAG